MQRISGLGCVAAALLLVLCHQAAAYYVPGTYPQEFRLGDKLQGDVTASFRFLLVATGNVPLLKMPMHAARSECELAQVVRHGNALRLLHDALLPAPGGRRAHGQHGQPGHDPRGPPDRELAIQLHHEGKRGGTCGTFECMESSMMGVKWVGRTCKCVESRRDNTKGIWHIQNHVMGL
jgi:hypothetical protein